jgi:hypothetical protein
VTAQMEIYNEEPFGPVHRPGRYQILEHNQFLPKTAGLDHHAEHSAFAQLSLASARRIAAQGEVLIASFADVGRGAMTEVPETVAK